jgi:hypothetical protein
MAGQGPPGHPDDVVSFSSRQVCSSGIGLGCFAVLLFPRVFLPIEVDNDDDADADAAEALIPAPAKRFRVVVEFSASERGRSMESS